MTATACSPLRLSLDGESYRPARESRRVVQRPDGDAYTYTLVCAGDLHRPSWVSLPYLTRADAVGATCDACAALDASARRYYTVAHDTPA